MDAKESFFPQTAFQESHKNATLTTDNCINKYHSVIPANSFRPCLQGRGFHVIMMKGIFALK